MTNQPNGQKMNENLNFIISQHLDESIGNLKTLKYKRIDYLVKDIYFKILVDALK
jgi:hypothetical protein